MDGEILRDEAVKNRIRAAQEFLDPGMASPLRRDAHDRTLILTICS